jgi:glycosyltransferase involved in cell wall biosynthesis
LTKNFKKLKVCFISTEIFAWGKHGGFGRATRLIGRELVKRGVEVYAVVPGRNGQKEHEILDGINVYSYSMFNPFSAVKIYKKINADIMHSQEPSFGSYLAFKALPDKKHTFTFRDTRLFNDWVIEFLHPSLHRYQVVLNFIYENNMFVKSAVKSAQTSFAAARFVSLKAKQKYNLKYFPEWLPTPIPINDIKIKKNNTPLVVYLGRLDKRKRPEKFLELTGKFPEIEFVVMGKSRDEKYNLFLRQKYGHLKNLRFMGFVDQFESSEFITTLSKAWILVNTSYREGLPNAFLEALSYECALLSCVNPDGLTELFGYHVTDDNFAAGLEKLIQNNNWKVKGEKGCEYVKENYALEKVIDLHLEMYKKVLSENSF